jgi:hypothetical protein
MLSLTKAAKHVEGQLEKERSQSGTTLDKEFDLLRLMTMAAYDQEAIDEQIKLSLERFEKEHKTEDMPAKWRDSLRHALLDASPHTQFAVLGKFKDHEIYSADQLKPIWASAIVQQLEIWEHPFTGSEETHYSREGQDGYEKNVGEVTAIIAALPEKQRVVAVSGLQEAIRRLPPSDSFELLASIKAKNIVNTKDLAALAATASARYEVYAKSFSHSEATADERLIFKAASYHKSRFYND